MSERYQISILRELAEKYRELYESEQQKEVRDLWRKHNSLQKTRPLIYVRAIPFGEIKDFPVPQCEDPFCRQYEIMFQRMLYHAGIGDDFTFTPYVSLNAACVIPPEGFWGVKVNRIPSPDKGGSYCIDPSIKTLEDKEKLVFPQHIIDEKTTAENFERLYEAIGDIIPIAVDRTPAYRMWYGDISTQLAQIRGLEQIMWDMIDNPEWLHDLLGFMRDGILNTHDQAEAAGDWRLCSHQNQAMPYAEELPDPSADPTPVTRDKLWVFMASQELTLVSPEMHDEFMLRYQIPIMEKFGLSAYGCCEDLTEKIDILRKIPNLRRIAVAPRANVERCAEQIGKDYIFSWRPNPAETVSCGFDSEHIRNATRQALTAARECIADITLKDVETIEGQPERLREWIQITREVIDEID